MKSLTNVSRSLVTSLYEGILGDIDINIGNMDTELDASLNFPDKNDVQQYRAGIRYYDWKYYKVLDNTAVRELLNKNHFRFHEEDHVFTPRIRVKICTTREDRKTYKHRIILGINAGYGFVSLGAFKEFEDISIKKAIDEAYNILKIIKLNPEMIEWLAERALAAGRVTSMTKQNCIATFDEAMNKFKKR